MLPKALLVVAGLLALGCGNPNPAAPLCTYGPDQSTVFTNEGLAVSCSPGISTSTATDTTPSQ